MDEYLSVIYQYVHCRLRTVDRLVRDGQQNCARGRRDRWSHLSLVFNCPPIIFHLSRHSGALWCRSTGTNPSPATALTLEGGQHQNQNQVSPTFGVSDDAPRATMVGRWYKGKNTRQGGKGQQLSCVCGEMRTLNITNIYESCCMWTFLLYTCIKFMLKGCSIVTSFTRPFYSLLCDLLFHVECMKSK